MINYSNLYKLYDLLGEIVFYGFRNHFSNEYIEESIISSVIFRDYLDKGDDSFVNNLSQKEIFLGTYNTEIEDEDLHKLNTISMWLGEAYLRLYFKYHKSMSFIFMYFSLDKMTNMFGVYHEMDWTHLYQYFEEEIEKKNLLSMFLKKRQITAYELSVLTGIKYQTIKNYTRSNKNIYNASFSNVSKISVILNVDNNTFLEEINNYVDASYLDLKVKNIRYLTNFGYRIAAYFDKSIGETTFEYDSYLAMLKTDYCCIKALVPSSSDFTSITKEIMEFKNECPINCDIMNLVIFVDSDIENVNIERNGFNKIFIITPQYVFMIEDNRTKKEIISKMLHEASIRLSKYSDAF